MIRPGIFVFALKACRRPAMWDVGYRDLAFGIGNDSRAGDGFGPAGFGKITMPRTARQVPCCRDFIPGSVPGIGFGPAGVEK